MTSSRREQLLDTAVRLFYRRGCHATGIDQLLAEAGVAKMTLYKHFKSKDDLVLAAAQRMRDLQWARLSAFVESHADNPRDRLLAVFDFIDEWAAGNEFHGCPFVNLSIEHPAPEHPVHQAAQRYKAEQQALFLDLARRAGLAEPERFTEHYMLLVEGAVVMCYVTGRREPIRNARDAVAALIGKASPPQDARPPKAAGANSRSRTKASSR